MSSSNNNDATTPGNLMGSMKQLEKDLEIFRSLYDEELKLMRLELEELESSRNKLQLNNYNLEVKLKDFIIKFEDIKKTNQELVDELSETKAKCNRVDYDFENGKLELEKVTRENAHYKKDIEDLLNKLNEKQIILDNQIAYSQDLELRLKELNHASAFEQRVSRREIESLKNKLTVSQESLDHISSGQQDSASQLNRSSSVQEHCYSERRHVQEPLKTITTTTTTATTMSKDTTGSSGSRVKFEGAEENGGARSTSQTVKVTFDAPSSRADNNNELRLHSENVWLKSQNDKLTEQNNFLMNTCKEMEATISNLEKALNRFKTQFSSISSGRSETVTKLTVNASVQQNAEAAPNFLLSARSECEKKKPIGPISPFSRGSKSSIIMPTRADMTTTTNDAAAASKTLNSAYMSDTHTTNSSSQQSSTMASHSHKTIVKSSTNLASSDYTNDLFKNFESATLMEKNNYSEPYTSSAIDNSITEASYTGNVKIHEVNKNGYYIRLLNVSDKIDEDLSNYTIQQMVSAMPVAVFRLPSSLKIKPGHTITVWSRTDEVDPQPPHTFVWYEQEKWGTGPECTTILAKPNGQAVSWTTGCHKYGNIDYDELVPVYSNKRNRSSVLSSSASTIQTQLNRQKLSPKTIYSPTKHPHGSNGLLSSADKSTKSMSNLSLWIGAGEPGAGAAERPESAAIKTNYFKEYKAQSNRSKASSVTIRGTFSGSTATRPQTCIGGSGSRGNFLLPRASSSSHKPSKQGNSAHEQTSNDEDYVYQANYMYQTEE